MLFGGLFSAYVLLRVTARNLAMWPHGWLNVRFGAVNTLILALSVITTLLAWAACKVRDFTKFRIFHACTILLALTFLGIKSYEYHDKWIHYEIALNNGTFAADHSQSGVYVKITPEDLAKKLSGTSFVTLAKVPPTSSN